MSTYTEKDKMRYLDKRKQGLCPRCVKPLDREGYYCSVCLEKVNRYGAENRKFYRSMGICPTCGKNKLFGAEKTCLECVAKACEYAAKKRKQDVEAYNKRYRENQKKRKERYKEAGLCSKCGKRKPKNGGKMCAICLEKIKQWRKSKGVGRKTEDRYERVAKGLCWYCDNPAEIGYKVCAEHHKSTTDWARKAHEVRKVKEDEQIRTNN